MQVHFSSKHAEHYAPPELLAVVVACLGAIDLDPCSNSHTDPNVPAAMHYTREDDGLTRPWFGRVFMNSPYGRRIINRWIAKLVNEFTSGHVTEAIALVPARPGSEWYGLLGDYAYCFLTGRLRFVGNENSAPFPSALFYLGSDLAKFYDHVSALGEVRAPRLRSRREVLSNPFLSVSRGCLGCGGDFRPTRRNQRYCRQACRLRAFRTRQERIDPDGEWLAQSPFE